MPKKFFFFASVTLFTLFSCSKTTRQEKKIETSFSEPPTTDSAGTEDGPSEEKTDSIVDGPETEQNPTISTDSRNETDSVQDDEANDSGAMIDVSNVEVLEPTPDCIHPEVIADCENGWCRIPAGCFIFGSPDHEGNQCRSMWAEDQEQVTLTRDFEMRQTEVTQAEWQEAGFKLPNPISQAPCPECPISWITIYEAMAYCNALSVNAGYNECYDLSDCTGAIGTGCSDEPLNEWGCTADDRYVCAGNVHRDKDPYACTGYRLPSTAEWEYAARAGTRTATYIGDMEPDIPTECFSHPSVDSIAWYCNNTDTSKPAYIPVGQKATTGFGLYNMLGNVAEYGASSKYNQPLGDLVGQDGPLVDPAPPLEPYDDNMEVVSRGGKYRKEPCFIRSARADPGVRAQHRLSDTGFRLVRTLKH